jgi:hypothetical protein
MLTIRSAQLAAMKAAAMKEAIDANVRLVVREAPRKAAAAGPSAIAASVGAAMERAPQLGITASWDLARFALLETLFGPGFEAREAWAAEVFARDALTATEKMDALERVFRNYLAKGFR